MSHYKLAEDAMKQGYMYYNEFTNKYYDCVYNIHITQDTIEEYFTDK